jgi:hypothetical protein
MYYLYSCDLKKFNNEWLLVDQELKKPLVVYPTKVFYTRGDRNKSKWIDLSKKWFRESFIDSCERAELISTLSENEVIVELL